MIFRFEGSKDWTRCQTRGGGMKSIALIFSFFSVFFFFFNVNELIQWWPWQGQGDLVEVSSCNVSLIFRLGDVGNDDRSPSD